MNTCQDRVLLELAGVRKSYGDNVVLRDLSLSVEQHQCVALIGASGSGKSTLLRCVNLLEIVDDGVITLDGRDITDPGSAICTPTRSGPGSAWCSSRSTCFRT